MHIATLHVCAWDYSLVSKVEINTSDVVTVGPRSLNVSSFMFSNSEIELMRSPQAAPNGGFPLRSHCNIHHVCFQINYIFIWYKRNAAWLSFQHGGRQCFCSLEREPIITGSLIKLNSTSPWCTLCGMWLKMFDLICFVLLLMCLLFDKSLSWRGNILNSMKCDTAVHQLMMDWLFIPLQLCCC